MPWMLDPVGWAFLALIGAGALLIVALVAPRGRAGRRERSRPLAIVAFPALVALLGVAGAAQTLFFPAHGAAVARRLPALVRPASSQGAADASPGDEPAAVGSGGMILSERDYLLATLPAGAPATEPATAAVEAHAAVAAGAAAPGPVSRDTFGPAPMPMLLAAVGDMRRHAPDQPDSVASLLKNATTAAGATNATGTTSATATDGGIAAPAGSAVAATLGPVLPDARAILSGGPPVTFLRGDPDGSAVPEPATWLTMVVGFGLCGRALRRARTGQGGIHGA